MNKQAVKNAKTIINSYEREDLERLFRVYGEVNDARRVADLICKSRENSPINTTEELGRAISNVLPKFGEHKYLAKIPLFRLMHQLSSESIIGLLSSS